MSPFSFAAVKAVHLNRSAISYQMPLLMLFKGLLYKGTSIKICVLTMGQYLLELIMNFENTEACCIGSTSVKNSGICKFRIIYMAF
jgi:hypothetical protein